MEETQTQKIKFTKIEAVFIILFYVLSILLILDGTISLVVSSLLNGFFFSFSISTYPQMPLEQRILVTLDNTNLILNDIKSIMTIMTGFIVMIAIQVDLYLKRYREINKKT